MGEINWVVSLLIGVIISIPIGIFTNIMTPIIQDKIEKATLSTQKKSLERLRKEFSEVKELHDDPNLFSVNTAKFLFSGIRTILLSMTVIFLIIGWFILKDSLTSFTTNIGSILVLVAIYFLVLFSEYNQIGEFGRIIVRLLNYEKYKKDIDLKTNELSLKDKESNKLRRKP